MRGRSFDWGCRRAPLPISRRATLPRPRSAPTWVRGPCCGRDVAGCPVPDSDRVSEGWEFTDVPGSALVVRGGELSSPSREKNLRSVLEEYGVWGICVKAATDLTPEEIAHQGPINNRTMMVAPAGALDAAGFRVVVEPGGQDLDALILFREEPTEEDWDTLRLTLSTHGVQENPAYRRR